MLRLGSEAAAAHPGVLTQCGGAWVHHVCDGWAVEVRVVSGTEIETLQARIRDFRDRMEPLLALARESGDEGSGVALKDAALDAAARAFGQDFHRVLGELARCAPRSRRDGASASRERARGIGCGYQAALESKDADLTVPDCPRCGRQMKRRRRKVPKAFLTRLGEITLRRSCCLCRRCGEGRFPLDDFLGLEGVSMSPGAERMIAEAVVEASSRRSVELLKELSGLDVGRTRLWEKADGHGADAARFERECADAAGEAPGRIYASNDGSGVPVRRDALEGRNGRPATRRPWRAASRRRR